MENAFRLHPWDIRRLTFDEFRRRAEYLIELAEARREGER
jgi:hypothetical protein